MLKFGFQIRTRSGALVENLQIHGHDQAAAEAKLLQMYPKAQILNVRTLEEPQRGDGTDLESVLNHIIGHNKSGP